MVRTVSGRRANETKVGRNPRQETPFRNDFLDRSSSRNLSKTREGNRVGESIAGARS